MALATGLDPKLAFVGDIEEFGAGRLRGWVFDPDCSGEPVALEVTLDGTIVMTIIAALPRADRDTDSRRGCVGFDASIDLSQASGRSLCVHVRERPAQRVGPLLLPGLIADPWSADLLGRGAHLVAHITASHEHQILHSTARFEHLFAHLTATHNETGRRIAHVFDHVSATHERILGAVAISQKQASRLSLGASGLDGIGYQAERQRPDDVERKLFKMRIETALAVP